MKKLALLFALIILQAPSFALMQMEDLKTPKEQFYRLGTSDTPEIKCDFDIKPTIQPVVQKEATVKT